MRPRAAGRRTTSSHRAMPRTRTSVHISAHGPLETTAAPPRPPLPGYRPHPLRRTPAALPARQRRSRDTRERLMAAVELVIRDIGLERATVRAIASRAGVAVGSIYRRFPNKRALLLAVQERFLARRAQRISFTLRQRTASHRPRLWNRRWLDSSLEPSWPSSAIARGSSPSRPPRLRIGRHTLR